MLARLQNAQDYVARCIAAGDESLLPLFERLEQEILVAEKKKNALERARYMAAKYRAENVVAFSNKTPASNGTAFGARLRTDARRAHVLERI
ncbi:hypothetical protein ACFORG_08340 [Lutimaribacter marinistellae]|uniref:Uncharacterized protein n=1 Tax=Lutimaribacter marinistellae TaxID=1820329 RepID=A0ABV7TFH6_9RHOB